MGLGPAIAAIGAGIAVLGAALGIGRIGGSSVESTARQPDAAGEIRTFMIIAAALIEGVALFALVICIIAVTAEPTAAPAAEETGMLDSIQTIANLVR